MRRMTRIRLAFLSYCFVLLALAVLAAEFWLLPAQQGLSRASLLNGFVAVPGSVIDGQRINALGFTGAEPTIPKPAGTLRVLLLGSSTLFNRHLGERLQTVLQQRTTQHVEVLDAGLRSHTSRADVLKWQLLSGYQWDVVVVYNGINDLWANHVRLQDYRHDYSHLDPWYRRGGLLEHSLVWRRLYNGVWHAVRAVNRRCQACWFPDYQFVFPSKPYLNAASFASLDSYRNNLDNLVQAIRTTGAKPVLLTFAWHLPDQYSRQAFLDHALGYHNPEHYDERDVFNWGSPDYVREGLVQQNAIVREVAAKEQVSLLDMDAAMSHQPMWFGDVCHFSETGVDAFNTTLAEAVLQNDTAR